MCFSVRYSFVSSCFIIYEIMVLCKGILFSGLEFFLDFSVFYKGCREGKEMPPNNLRKPIAEFADFIRFTLKKSRRLFSGSS
ncbi:MAG TPA: hypothetical protein DCZ91_24625 [Lachnospiraceae bacterium]|nr:hypothetical protein [Lachnospiraceae bacterium]